MRRGSRRGERRLWKKVKLIVKLMFGLASRRMMKLKRRKKGTETQISEACLMKGRYQMGRSPRHVL